MFCLFTLTSFQLVVSLAAATDIIEMLSCCSCIVLEIEKIAECGDLKTFKSWSKSLSEADTNVNEENYILLV